MNTIAPRSIRRRVGPSLLGCLFLSFVGVVPASHAQDAPVRETVRDDRFLEGYVTAVVSRDFPLDKVSVVDVRDGVVTLSASGLAATQRGRVEAVVADIQGVTRVEVVDAKQAGSSGPVASVPQKEEGTTLLPKGVLFEPLRADPRWPRFSVAYRYFPSDKELDHVGAANFGESIALVRGPAFWDGHWEAGLQAGGFSIFDLASDSNDLVNAAGSFRKLLADKGYDADHFRRRLAAQQAEAVIPARSKRKHPAPHDVVAYRDRNTVERLWARLKDYRRVATRYDKRADTFLSGVLIAAVICYWIK